MNGSNRRLRSALGISMLLLLVVLARPAVAATHAPRINSSLAQTAFSWLSALVGLFLPDESDLGAGPDPWGGPAPKPEGDLGAGIDPDG